jgi:GTP-binding protein Era
VTEGKKSAFIAVVGRPSAGKSTLVNALCGWKVSIVSPVPQTTRNQVRGIVNGEAGQLVLLDTPGYHDSERKLNARLKELAQVALSDADVILYVLDASRRPGAEEGLIASLVSRHAARTVVAVNKIDARDADPGAAIAFAAEAVPGAAAIQVSALKGEGLTGLLSALYALSPAGPAYYPEEFATDQEPEFRMAEIIREKAFLHTKDEVPHAVYAEVCDAEWSADRKALRVRAFLVAERESQKGILIGKGASMIKRIREEAERDMNEIFPWRVKLDLQVRVDKDWRKDESTLKRLGISHKE